MLFHQKVGKFGSEPGCLDNPAGLAVDGEGNMLVADSKNHRISVFSPKVVVSWKKTVGPIRSGIPDQSVKSGPE